MVLWVCGFLFERRQEVFEVNSSIDAYEELREEMEIEMRFSDLQMKTEMDSIDYLR